ncbi:MAG: hypothetical protein ACLFWF_00945 [Alphaproteobacteria bacterium]
MKFLKALIGGRTGGEPAEPEASVEEVVAAYEDVLSRTGGGEVRRVSDLPFEKPLIKQALMTAMELADDEEKRFTLESEVVSLGDFQDFEACERRGLSPEEARVKESKALLAELKTR